MWIIVVSVLVGLGRFLIPGHNLSWAGTYEAFAHIWVGALLVFVFERNPPSPIIDITTERRQWAIVSLVAITVIEGVMFYLFKQSSGVLP